MDNDLKELLGIDDIENIIDIKFAMNNDKATTSEIIEQLKIITEQSANNQTTAFTDY